MAGTLHLGAIVAKGYHGGTTLNKRLLIYVEGATEELFVNRMLRNHLAQHGVAVQRPVLAATSLAPAGQRGGFVNWEAVEADLRTLFASDTDANLRFTTLLDTYALPSIAPGYPGPSASNHRTAAEVDAIQAAWMAHFSEPRFVPYLQRHEFEALVLAHPASLRTLFPQFASKLADLEQSLAGYANAEEIDDGPASHPSRRIQDIIPTYEALKASHGLFALLEAGLANTRLRCPRFDAWLSRWEQWGAQP
jgi:hypothetical protein